MTQEWTLGIDQLINSILLFFKKTFILSDENHFAEQSIDLLSKILSNLMNWPILILSIFIFGRVCSHYQTKKTKFYF